MSFNECFLFDCELDTALVVIPLVLLDDFCFLLVSMYDEIEEEDSFDFFMKFLKNLPRLF